MKRRLTLAACMLYATFSLVVAHGVAYAGDRPKLRFERAGEAHCGVVDVYRIAPYVRLKADLDGDRTPEVYIASGAEFGLYHEDATSDPPRLVRDATLYSPKAGDRYECVDLIAQDVDGDARLDLIYGSPAAIAVFKNTKDGLKLLKSTAVSGFDRTKLPKLTAGNLPGTKKLRITLSDGSHTTTLDL